MQPVLSYFGRTRSLKANLPIDVVLATEFGRPIVEGIVGSGPAYRKPPAKPSGTSHRW